MVIACRTGCVYVLSGTVLKPLMYPVADILYPRDTSERPVLARPKWDRSVSVFASYVPVCVVPCRAAVSLLRPLRCSVAVSVARL